jgi:hypothetical protein
MSHSSCSPCHDGRHSSSGQHRAIAKRATAASIEASFLIRACVVDGKAGSVSAPIDKPVQLQEVQIAVDADRRGIVESELNRPVDNRWASLSRARVVWTSDRGTLVVTFHHEIADAVSSIRILSDLMLVLSGVRLTLSPSSRNLRRLNQKLAALVTALPKNLASA